MSTADVLNTKLTVFPDMYFAASIDNGVLHMKVTQCAVISIICIQFAGKMGFSNMAMAEADIRIPDKVYQNNTCIMFSPNLGRLLSRRRVSDIANPANTGNEYPMTTMPL